MSGVRAPQFIPALNGLRGIAALAVLHSHAGWLPNALVALTDPGDRGVMLFFCLSGLLMAELYLRQDATRASIWRFICARFARIFPLFVVVVIGSALIYHFDHRFPFQLGAFAVIKHLFLFGDGLTMWSISVEFQFYAIFVGLWLLCAAVPEKHRTAGFALVCVGLAVALWVAEYPGGKISITHYGQFFLVGILAAIIHWRIPAAGIIGRSANLVLPVLLVALMLWPSHGADPYQSLPLLILAGTVVLAAVAGRGFFAEGTLGSHCMVYLGDVSFGIYLLHRPVIYFWENLIGLQLHWTAMYLIVTATLLAVSHIAHRWIEQPARRIIWNLRQLPHLQQRWRAALNEMLAQPRSFRTMKHAAVREDKLPLPLMSAPSRQVLRRNDTSEIGF